jgi:hypothetical protein
MGIAGSSSRRRSGSRSGGPGAKGKSSAAGETRSAVAEALELVAQVDLHAAGHGAEPDGRPGGTRW